MGVSRNGGTPIAGWFIYDGKYWGYFRYFRKPPYNIYNGWSLTTSRETLQGPKHWVLPHHPLGDRFFSLDSRCKGIGVAGNVAGERVVHFLSKSIDLSEDGDGKI